MSKPSDHPTWATDATYPAGSEPEAGDANKVEPSGAKQGIGWRPNEKPPAEHFNWWMNLVYLWQQWTQEDKVDTYAASEWMSPNNTVNVVDGHLALASAQVYYMPIRAEVGSVIKRFDFEIFGDAADDMTLAFIRRELGVDTVITSAAFNDASASWDLVDFDVTDTTVVMGRSYYLKISGIVGEQIRIGGVFVTRSPG